MEELNQNKALEFKALSPEESKLLAALYESKFLFLEKIYVGIGLSYLMTNKRKK